MEFSDGIDVESTRNVKIKLIFGPNQLDLSVPPDYTFGELKQVVAQKIGVEPQVQKLLFRGVEKDDNDHLSTVGVKDNSKILLMLYEPLKKGNHEEVMASSEVSIGEAAVAEVREEVDKLSGQVLAVEAVIQNGTRVDEKDILYLTEMLMRQLLKLDGIEAQGEGKLQRKIEVSGISFTAFLRTVVRFLSIVKTAVDSVCTSHWVNSETAFLLHRGKAAYRPTPPYTA